MNFLITVSLACGWSANAGNEASLFVCFTSRLLFALAQRGLNSLADEFRPLVLADERVNSLRHALRQPHKNRLHFPRGEDHAPT